MKQEQSLVDNMRTRAYADKLPLDHALYKYAQELELATTGYFAATQTVPVHKFVGAWARARKVWCEYTGEPLI